MADMVDFTRLMEVDRDGTIGLIRELRERWLEPEAAKRGGDVINRMGDGWLITFASISDAIETAQIVQTELASHKVIKLRIAVHLGEVTCDGTDFFGSGINIAARLQSEAPPGGAMISEDLYHQLDGRLTDGFHDAGTFELKNIVRPVTAYQWRPDTFNSVTVDDVPTIAVEAIAIAPDQQDLREAAIDLQQQLVMRLSRRTGINVVSLSEGASDRPTYSVRGRIRAGKSTRIAISLVVEDTGRVIWSDVYEDSNEDLFVFVDGVAERVDDELRLSINMLDGERLIALPDESLNASELRSRAAHSLYSATLSGFERGLSALDRALDLVPDNAMSLAMWAHVRTWILMGRFEKPDPELAAKIVARADEAVEKAPRSDFVVKTRAEVQLKVRGDVTAARRSCERARQINPAYALLKIVDVEIALADGEWNRVVSLVNAYLEQNSRDPYLTYMLYAAAIGELAGGRPDSALRWIERAIEHRPTCRGYRLLKTEILRETRDNLGVTEAIASAEQLSFAPDIAAPYMVLPAEEVKLIASLQPKTR